MIGIKSTVYRTSDETPLVPALIEASEDGKQSVCLVEIKARGDERRNIEWSRALEQAASTRLRLPTLKIHAKTTLVVRARAAASAATSISAPATQQRDREDVRGLRLSPWTRRSLPTSPTCSTTSRASVARHASASCSSRPSCSASDSWRRSGSRRHRARGQEGVHPYQGQRSHARRGDRRALRRVRGRRADRPARRGVCSLRPGVSGHEREHPRSQRARPLPRAQQALHLRRGRQELVDLGSVDLMPRNLDHRVQVVALVEDVGLQSEPAATIEALLSETATAWELDAEGAGSACSRRRTSGDARRSRCRCGAPAAALRSRVRAKSWNHVIPAPAAHSTYSPDRHRRSRLRVTVR